jgi:hypothetical protein
MMYWNWSKKLENTLKSFIPKALFVLLKNTVKSAKIYSFAIGFVGWISWTIQIYLPVIIIEPVNTSWEDILNLFCVTSYIIACHAKVSKNNEKYVLIPDVVFHYANLVRRFFFLCSQTRLLLGVRERGVFIVQGQN